MKNQQKIKWLIYPVLVVVISVLSAVSAFAADNSYLSYEFIGNSCIVTECDDEAKGQINVPETVNGKDVVGIKDNAFSDCYYLTGINLPETVRSIGNGAFASCISLEMFDMPDSVENLGNSIFSNCVSLRIVNLSQSVNIVPEETFYMCKALKEIEISEDTTLFGKNAFKGCSSLRSIVLPGNLYEISSGCFSNCSSLEKVYLPLSVLQICRDAFEKCTSLNTVYYQSSERNFEKISILAGNDSLLHSNVIFNHNHRSASVATSVEATSEEDGYTTYDCVCGFSETSNYVVAKGHELTEYLKIYEPDCVNTGLAYLKCANCNFYEELILSLKQHTPVIDAAVKSDCINTGLTQGSHCSVCGKVLTAQNKVPVSEHSFTKKISDKAHLATQASYTVPATYYLSCDVCDAISKDKTYTGATLSLGITGKIVSTSSNDSITLSWNKVADATGYAVFYKNTSGKWQTYKYLTANTLKMTKLPSGRLYEFAVRAYVTERGKTVFSPSFATHKEATRPLPPGKVVAVQNENAIQLNWTASAGATNYQVFYYNTVQKKWIVIGYAVKGCKHTIYNLKPGVAFTFAVRPYINTGAKNVHSSSYISISTCTKPIAPILKSTPLKGAVRLNWDKVSGADGYVIYGSSSPNSGYVKFAITSGLTYTKNGLVSGRTYYFKAYSYKRTPAGVVYSYAGPVKTVTTR